jgi:hypothetical protein
MGLFPDDMPLAEVGAKFSLEQHSLKHPARCPESFEELCMSAYADDGQGLRTSAASSTTRRILMATPTNDRFFDN